MEQMKLTLFGSKSDTKGAKRGGPPNRMNNLVYRDWMKFQKSFFRHVSSQSLVEEGIYFFTKAVWPDGQPSRSLIIEVENQGAGAEELNGTKLLDLLGLPADTTIEEQSPDDFFADLVEEQDWWGDAEKADAERYQALRRILEAHLDSLHIFRVGEVEVSIYLLGRCEGDWVGLRTLSVET